MPVESLRIKNFKSIKDLPLKCRKVNLFIGEPNTGKSNILEAIGLLSHVWHGNIKNFVRFEVMTDLFYDRVLDDPLSVSFDNYTLRVKFRDGGFHGAFEMKRETPPKVASSHLFDYSYAGGTSRGRVGEFRQFKFYRFIKRSIFQNQESEFLQPPDGDNLLAVIMTRKRLRGITKQIFEKFGYRIVFKPPEGKIEVQKELEDIIFSFPYSLASETLQRLVFYLAAIHSNKDSIITFEEPEKNSNPRIFPVSAKLIAMLQALPKENHKVFGNTTPRTRRWCFILQRKRLARKLKNPRLNQIHFHTLRHWKASMEYHKTKDIMHVKELLGHKSINSTMIYIQIEKAMFKYAEDEFTSKVAKTINEAQKLVEVGFEYVCDFGAEGKLFRKRK